MKKISFGIVLLISVIIYQLFFTNIFFAFNQYKFNESLGLLSERLQPYEKDYLKLIYSRISRFEEERINAKSTLVTYNEENLRTFYNKTLNRLTDKYLNYTQINTEIESEQNDSTDLDYKEKVQAMFERLEPMISNEDFEKIKILYENYNKLEEYKEIEEIRKIISSYKDINENLFIEFILDPMDIKAYFPVDNQKNIILKSLDPIIETPPSKDEIDSYQLLWDYIKLGLGTKLLSPIDSFIVYSDGKDETLAYVNYIDNKASRWYMAVDIADSLKQGTDSLNEDFYFTIVHELAHVITLNDTQATYDSDPVFGQYNEGNITLNQGSYLDEFYNRFWINLIEESIIIQNQDIEDNNYRFFLRHDTKFVTDYAATSPSEDIAESFAYFVINDKPTGNDIWEQKIRFFYEFEELVKIRNSIRERLDDMNDVA